MNLMDRRIQLHQSENNINDGGGGGGGGGGGVEELKKKLVLNQQERISPYHILLHHPISSSQRQEFHSQLVPSKYPDIRVCGRTRRRGLGLGGWRGVAVTIHPHHTEFIGFIEPIQ